MIGYSTSAKRWKLPFGAGREMTRGFVRAAVVRSRGARASTDRRRAVFRLTGRNRLACTPTLRPAARRGFAAFAQRCLVPSVSFSARRCFSVWRRRGALRRHRRRGHGDCDNGGEHQPGSDEGSAAPETARMHARHELSPLLR